MTGPDTVIEAMAAGKLAAEMIDKHLRGQPLAEDFGYRGRRPTCRRGRLTRRGMRRPRSGPCRPACRSTQRRGSFAEVDLTLDRGNGRPRSPALSALRPANGRRQAAAGATTVRDEQRRNARVDDATLTIDGQQVAAAPGTTVLEAALAAGIYIPHLCHHPDLKPVGVCRLCMVEIAGAA